MGPLAPLSYAQLRMWLFAQLYPESHLYHQLRVTRWIGTLNVGALENSLSELVQRHEILRARFRVQDGEVYQEAADQVSITIPVEHVPASPTEPRQAVAVRRARELAFGAFNLQQGPLIRAVLLRLGPAEHYLVLVIHHLGSDGWSARLLLRELCALYTSRMAGESAHGSGPASGFTEFAIRQRTWLEGPEAERELAYWRDRLRGASPLLELPTDHPRPLQTAYEGGQVAFCLPDPLVKRLRLVVRKQRATLFMTLFAAFQAVLSRWSSQTDLVIGVPVAGRPRVELENVIGCFTNTLALRTDLSGDPSFRELLHQVRTVLMGGFAHQELPFERVVQELRPTRTQSYHPLFQVMFNLRDFAPLALSAPGLEVEVVPVDVPGRSFVDLSVELDRVQDGYVGAFGYDASLFERVTVERLTADYLAVLEAVSNRPDLQLRELPIASAEIRPRDEEAAARALTLIERLSEDEVRRLLANTAGELPT